MDTDIKVIITITILCWLALWFMVRRPAMWDSIVEKENAFWVNRGFVRASSLERIKRFEKSRGLKILIGTVAVLDTLFLIYHIWMATR